MNLLGARAFRPEVWGGGREGGFAVGPQGLGLRGLRIEIKRFREVSGS